MNKFDEIINSKKSQLNELAGGTANVQQIAQGQPQQGQPQQPVQGQQPQQGQQSDPAQILAQAFQGMKFADPNTSVQVLNNALKTAGNAPGIKEFFGSLAFDPKQGFMITQQKAGAAPQQQGATQQAPGTQPLK